MPVLVDLCDKSCFARKFAWLGKRNATIAPVQPKVTLFYFLAFFRCQVSTVAKRRCTAGTQHLLARILRTQSCATSADLFVFCGCSMRGGEQKKAVKILSLSQDKKLYALLSSGSPSDA